MQRAQVWHAMGPMSLACDPELEIVATLIVGKGKINHDKQGLVNVPFWEYWTSPYSSHYRPYT